LKKIKNSEYGAVGITKELKKTLGIELQNTVPLLGL
jgi:hypothetical protein